VTEYRLDSAPRVDRDIAAAYQWYEAEQAGLGSEFLDQLVASYDRMAAIEGLTVRCL
jgi:hypothetical protein